MGVIGKITAADGVSAASSDVAHGIELTPAHVGIAGAGLTYGDLTPTSNNISSSADGEIIEGWDVTDGRITVNHNNVIVRNCRVNATGDYGIHVNGGSGSRVEWCEIYGSDSASLYLETPGNSAYRCRIEDAVDSVKIGTDWVLTECYISGHKGDNPDAPAAHMDCVQSVGGSNGLIERCYLRLDDYLDAGAPNGCIQWGANFSPISDYTAEDCYFWGAPQANYAFRVGSKSSQPDPSNITVTGCIWEDGAWTSGPVNLPTDKVGWVWTNNTTTTGTSITI